MNIDLTPEQRQLIQAKLDAGKYESAQELLDIALRLLNDYEQAEARWLHTMHEQIENAIAASEKTPSVDGGTFIDQVLDEKFHASLLEPRTESYRINVRVISTLEEIANYHAFFDIYAGERFFRTFDETCRQLVRSPGRGQRYDRIRLGLRGFRLSGNVVFYRIAETGLEVVSMASTHRNLPSPLDESGLK